MGISWRKQAARHSGGIVAIPSGEEHKVKKYHEPRKHEKDMKDNDKCRDV